MIKKIPAAQLELGMFVHNLNCGWLNHPFARGQFIIKNRAALDTILSLGITEVDIDTDRRIQIEENEESDSALVTKSEIADLIDADLIDEPAAQPTAFIPNLIINLSPAQKFAYAKDVCTNASRLMLDMMKDIRLGKQVDLEQCEPMVDNIIDVMYSFPSAMLPLAQMKTRDEYTYQHSVSVAALAVAFGRVLDLPPQEIKDLSMGGLLHDVGKAKIPGKILNKPGKLDDAEFAAMKNHATHTAELISKIHGLSPVSFNAASQHHERWDGTGYPDGLKGEEISLHGRMLAIVDVYDALTSIRVYHKAKPPSEALHILNAGRGSHFDPSLVGAFIEGIGIYPAGSLVRLKSKKLGIVREIVPDRLLQPTVQLIYDIENKCSISPEIVDLSTSDDHITSHESFEAWGINQARWATTFV